MKIRINTMWAACVCILAVGCSTAPESPYRDPGEMRGRTTDFTTYDMQQCATYLVDQLLGDAALDKRLKAQFGDSSPSVAVRIENLTYQLSVTDKLKKAMFNAIETRLLNSERFEFVDRSAERLIVGDTVGEIDSGMVTEGSTASIGTAKGVDYILVGELEEFREGDGRVNDTYYAMTVKLLNKRTNRVDWSGRKEIRKVSSRPLVGW